MDIQLNKSFFSRQRKELYNLKKLKKILRMSSYKIIQFCKTQSKKLKKRNQNQLILFPKDYQWQESPEASQTLRQKYIYNDGYPFYLSKCQLFIDSYHLKILKQVSPLAIKFDGLGYGKIREFANWISKYQSNILIGITTLNYILIISTGDKFFFKYRIQKKGNVQFQQIINVSVYQDYFFAFSQKQCHICKYKNTKTIGKGLQKILQRIISDKKITKGYGIQKDNKYYLFMIVQNNLIIQRLQLGILSKIDFKNKITYTCNNQIINLQIKIKNNNQINHILIAITTIQQSKILIYSFQLELISQICNKQNPIIIRNKNIPTYLQFINRDHYNLCAIAFYNRLYFIKIFDDYCQISRRIKFQSPVQFVSHFGRSSGIIVVTNRIEGSKNKRKIYLTHQNKLITFHSYNYTQLIQKFELNIQSSTSDYIKPFSISKAITIHNNRQLLIIGDNQIQRIVLNTWTGIYNQMVLTQNIKLLKFLILLKYIDSPFLQKPNNFKGLEKFFPIDTHQSKQILLEYYSLMDMEPALIDITTHQQLMIPFIIQHQISNLSDSILECLLNWCIKYDERLVEQLIIGGSDCGWQIAVSKGWIRAFKVMVQRGMQLQMPILKLYSMSLYEIKIRQDDSKQIKYLSIIGQKYLDQLIDYILFILSQFFKDLNNSTIILQYKNIICLILKDQFWIFMNQYLPIKSINILYYIFLNQQRIKQINKQSSIIFINFHKKYHGLNIYHNPTNSQIILSHLSTIYQQLSNQQNIDYLQIQHSKLLIIKYQQYLHKNNNRQYNFQQSIKYYHTFINQPYYSNIFQQQYIKLKDSLRIKTYFRFKRQYIVQLLKILVKNNNLQTVFNYANPSEIQPINYQDYQCQMIDFLIFLWIQVYFNLIQNILQSRQCDDEKYSLQQCDIRIKNALKNEIKQILSQIQQYNFEYQQLTIHLLMSINIQNQFTSKIFQKFLSFKNNIYKQRIFIWLRQTLPYSIQLQDQIIIKLKQVIAINNQQSRQILSQFYQGKQKNIIKKIDNDPHLQLQYLELIINNATQQLQRYYTNLHIELVLKIKPQALINIFQTDNQMVQYDIAQALKMTLAADDFPLKDQVLSYLYQRQGQIMQSINTNLNCFENLIQSYIILCERSKPQQQQTMNLSAFMYNLSDYQIQKNRMVNAINEKYSQSIKLLFRVSQRKNYISCYLSRLYSIFSNIKRRQYKFKQHYLQFTLTYFGQFLITLFQRNCLIQFSQWIQQQKLDLLDFILQLKKYLIQGYQKMLIQIIILNSMNIMEKRLLIKQIHQALYKLQYCISSESYCYVCQRTFDDTFSNIEGLLFSCGHIYHKNCIEQVNDQDFCFYCVSKNQYKSMIQNQSLFLVQLLKKFKEKRKQKQEQEIIRVEGRKRDGLISQNKKRINRLGLFDKKATAIENQAEIIDLKLMIEEYYSNQLKN